MRHCLGLDAVCAAIMLFLACVAGFPALIAHADVGTTADPTESGDGDSPDAFLEDINTYGYWRTDRGPLQLTVIHGNSLLHYPGFEPSMIVYILRGNQYFALTGDNGSGECESGETWGRVLLEPDGPDRFTGFAKICDGSTYRTESWNGVLIAGSTWFSPDLWIGEGVRRTELDMSEDQAHALMQRTQGDDFVSERAQSFLFDFTCDGGLDRVYLWNSNGGGLRLSVAHNQRPLFEFEDTGSVETIELGTVDDTGRGCPTESASDFQVAELDTWLRGMTGAPSYAPTCSQILVGPGKRCRIHWDLETGTFGMY